MRLEFTGQEAWDWNQKPDNWRLGLIRRGKWDWDNEPVETGLGLGQVGRNGAEGVKSEGEQTEESVPTRVHSHPEP